MDNFPVPVWFEEEEGEPVWNPKRETIAEFLKRVGWKRISEEAK